jgi:sugar phosphate isomerase/epimerase
MINTHGKMKGTNMHTRRQFLQTGLFATIAATLPEQILFAQATAKKPAITLALQTYTLRKFDFDEIIKKTREAGINEVEIAGGNRWAGQNRRSATLNADERRQLRSLLEENRIRAISLGGSQGTPEDFEFAKEMGMDFLQGEPPIDKLVEVSKRAEEYGIRFALHNHAKPTTYWDYRENLKRVKDCAPALGFCPDTGHYTRSGFDPLQVIKDMKGRLVSVHLKDLNGTNPEADPEVKLQDVAWGTGKGQAEAVLKELIAQEFVGPVIIEYDHIYEDGNVEDVKKCAAFFHKIIIKP